MISLAERRLLIAWIDLAVSEGARLNKACGIIGLSTRTLQRWRQPKELQADGRITRAFTPANKLCEIAGRMKAEEALIAIPSATSEQMRAIVARCEESGVPFKTVPGLGELINGRVTENAIREVDYRDLLGREPIHVEERRIGAYLENARVLVTGAGGSIADQGSEFVDAEASAGSEGQNLRDYMGGNTENAITPA